MFTFCPSSQTTVVPAATLASSRRSSRPRSRLSPHVADLFISAALTIGAAIIPVTSARAAPPTQAGAPADVKFGTVKVNGLNIAYREAGDPSSPKLVLLHGFPASSH